MSIKPRLRREFKQDIHSSLISDSDDQPSKEPLIMTKCEHKDCTTNKRMIGSHVFYPKSPSSVL